MPPLGPSVPSALRAGACILAQNSRHELYNPPTHSPVPLFWVSPLLEPERWKSADCFKLTQF